jgi:hypothetical protein
LGTTESTTLALKREVGGKIRVASLLWEALKVILRNEVLEIPATWMACCALPANPGTPTNGTVGRALGPRRAGHRRNDKA